MAMHENEPNILSDATDAFILLIFVALLGWLMFGNSSNDGGGDSGE